MAGIRCSRCPGSRRGLFWLLLLEIRLLQQIKLQREQFKPMKIAVVTDDGQTISQHFGQASYYLVLTVEDGKITDRELRKKPGHSDFKDLPHPVHVPGESLGFDPAAQDRHTLMADAIADTQVLICGGMGAGAFQSLNLRGIEPILTDIPQIEEAVQAYLDGSIVNLTNRLH